MPRVSLTSDKYKKLGVLMVGFASADNKGLDDIARIIGTCSKTAGKYLKSPEKLPFDKLMKLARNLSVPIDELRECVRY